MKYITKIPQSELNLIAPFTHLAQQNDEQTQPFFQYAANFEAFEQVILDQQAISIDRETLVNTLFDHYKGIPLCCEVADNIEALSSPKTFTITTAHQPCLFTGPMYFVYKILSAIKLAQDLKKTYPAYQFVPVYWMGAEDHDFDEINHANVHGKRFTWASEQTGAVGRMHTEEFESTVNNLIQALDFGPFHQHLSENLKRAYNSGKTYARATMEFVHELFKHYGVLVIQQDSIAFKQQMKSIFKTELLEQKSNDIVQDTNVHMAEAGFKPQAYSRPINLFYLKDDLRARIELDKGQYHIVGTSISFTEAEILAELDQHPERFSPNVILRPLYQQTILPNLAYIGGPSEVIYWGQLKQMFEHFEVFYPMVLLRDMALIVNGKQQKVLNKYRLNWVDMFQSDHHFVRKVIERDPVDYRINHSFLNRVEQELTVQAGAIDVTLSASAKATIRNIEKSLEKLEKRFYKGLKNKHNLCIEQLKQVQAELFPNGTPQERFDSFLPHYAALGPRFFELLLTNFNCLDTDLKVYQL